MKLLLLFFFSSALMAAAQPKALFYMTDNPNSVKSFSEHADKIDTLVPAWYSVDGNGLVWGGPNPDVMRIAAAHHVPVMPIVAAMVQIDLHKLFTTRCSAKRLHRLTSQRVQEAWIQRFSD